MASRNERRRTVRQDTGTGSPTSPVQLNPSRRNLNAIRGSYQGAERTAAALQKAFGVGFDVYKEYDERTAERNFLEGKQAALGGEDLTPGEKKRVAWLKGYTSVTAQAEFIQFQRELEDEIKGMDLTSMSAKEFNNYIAERLTEQYQFDADDELDKYTMGLLQPGIEKLELAAKQVYADVNAQALDADLDAAFSVAVEAELDRTGDIDLEVLNKQVFSVYNPSEANKEVVDLITGIAIRQGRPDLVEKLIAQKHWKGGAGAPGGNREFDSVLQNARLQAENQKARNEADAETASLKVSKAESEKYYSDVTLKVLTGVSAEQDIIDGLKEGYLTGPQAQALTRFIKGYADNASAGDPNFDRIWEYRQKYLKDTTDLEGAEEELLELAASGALGDSETRRTIVEQELQVIQRRRAARLADPTYKVEETELKGEYAVSQTTWNNEPKYRKAQNNAVIRMAELVLEGTPADKAREQALQEFPVPTLEGSNALTRAINAVEAGTAPEESLIAQRTSGETMQEFVERLAAAGVNISAQTRRKWANQ